MGAGRGVRGTLPSAIIDIDEHGRVLDWLLDAFGVLDSPDILFVAGYKADEVVERYPQIRTILNRDWTQTGPVHSLALAPIGGPGHTYVCYSDVVFRRTAVAALADAPGEVAVAIDSAWRRRYDGRTHIDLEHAEKVRCAAGRVVAAGADVSADDADAEFAGMLRLGPAGTAALMQAMRSGAFAPTATLPDLVRWLLEHGYDVAAVDLDGAWAELDAKQDLARFVLGTKAESLARLRDMDHGGEIDPLVAFTASRWHREPAAVLDEIESTLPGDRLIVRSSALTEDGWAASAAGQHESVLDVAREVDAVRAAIDRVLASYSTEDPEHQVLVQTMLVGVAMSGVVMTRTHAAGAPYYVVNFDDTTARTDTVTGGAAARTVFVHRDAPVRPDLPEALRAVLLTVQNIEKLVGHDSLDIEFAVTGDGRVHVLQVRPIAVVEVPAPIDDALVASALENARAALTQRRPPPPTLVGSSTQYSVMSDWNPAEIVGTKPKRLALSLYRMLVTDDVWARQRAEYGYRDVRPCPLLFDIAGHPYVDVRATFTSFVPAALPDELAGRLVDASLAQLRAEPALHDKVEFAVLLTCLTPDFETHAARLVRAGISEPDIAALREALREITARAVDRLDGDLARSRDLAREMERITARGGAPLAQASLLLDATRRIGTPAFAHCARAAFVATSILRGLEARQVITAEQQSAFAASIETVLGAMRTDAYAVRQGSLGFDAFVARYGHLRPGTYDITSPCYAQAPSEYLQPVVDSSRVEAPVEFVWDARTRAAMEREFARLGLAFGVDEFDRFARNAIAGREAAKFEFTRALSAALELLAEFGAGLGIERSELAHVRVEELLACNDVLADPQGHVRRRALEGREAYNVTQGICLPGHLVDADDLLCFEQHEAEPNFVSQLAVEGVVLAGDVHPGAEVENRIVLIPSADPGYDWLLARSIRGLVTMYGGANSHMAVRAAELGLPAAIGVGELLYERLETARVIRLDCASRTVAPLS